MSFDPITPPSYQNVMMNQGLHMRMVEGGSALDKPTFMEKFKLGLAKFGAVFARIGASVLRFFPGLGTVASAGLYGISNLAQYSYEKQVNNRMANLQRDQAATQMDYNMLTPGFGMFTAPQGADAPDGLGPDKLGVVLNREVAARGAIDTMGVG
jgi:hypothetical protein